jgi:hypothetical protein
MVSHRVDWIIYCMDFVHPQEAININGARRFGTGSVPVLRLKIRLRLTQVGPIG